MGKNKYNTETLIEASKKCHISKFDNLSYERTKYEKYNQKVIVTCHNTDDKGREHGDFQISIYHLLNGQGCPKCRYLKSADSKRRSLEKVVSEAKKVHGDKYDYSLIEEYKNDRIKYPILCYEHGKFYQTFNNHIKFKQGCPVCGKKKCHDERKMTFEEFTYKANKRHNNKYVYHDDDAFNHRVKNTKIKITCPVHGDFYQTIPNHLHGQGCPICKTSKLEQELTRFLIDNDVEYEYQKKFDWLKNKRLDFYLPKYNAAIECQGIQHFVEDHFYEPLETTQQRDKHKKQLCEENGIKVFYYSNLGIKYPYQVFEDKKKLLEKIMETESEAIMTS